MVPPILADGAGAQALSPGDLAKPAVSDTINSLADTLVAKRRNWLQRTEIKKGIQMAENDNDLAKSLSSKDLAGSLRKANFSNLEDGAKAGC